jgi:hypothetical protein
MSYSRNLKRIAGPGFHVNVRYDDHQMSKAKNAGAAGGCAAVLSKGMRLPEIWDVKEQEILVTMDSSRQATYFDGYTHCFSTANYFPGTMAFTDPSKSDQLKEAILQQVKFVGVATTDFQPRKGYIEQGFVAQVGGVTTLLNESTGNIYPGDKVMLDVNVNYARKIVREKGIPREKVRFTLRRAYTTDELLAEAIGGMKSGPVTDTTSQQVDYDAAKAALQKADAKKDLSTYNKLKKEKQKAGRALAEAKAKNLPGGGIDGLKEIMQKMRNLNERVIGKAYPFARPGDRLEVGLQPRSEF